jgi:hypothetical protein
MYIGIGTVVLVLVIILVVFLGSPLGIWTDRLGFPHNVSAQL